ncbi:NHL repeat-containing protein [Lignipirellula cremea]|uniref:NHL repeat protein n=1 Tax=Lignipirellula cremea TaxID=2528010 RepID=A0A518DWD0_9BACT|nr:hypothetical protein [Lignipirellula cremea]QDU96138.1 NHL repeat protein [Lignipirellula cremea]
MKRIPNRLKTTLLPRWTFRRAAGLLALTMLASLVAFDGRSAVGGEAEEEFRVKREERFEFSQPPVIAVQGDRVEIRFTAAAFCDATVAIEDAEGNIVRHLACGLLGSSAPAPFQPSLLSQVLLWDGKNDQGRYVDQRDNLIVRVSLGLKAQFERTLYWEPKKRIGKGNSPLIAPRPEGVYVFEGEGVDHMRLFEHNGDYVRTVYPFPAENLEEVVGLDRQIFPQSGRLLPVKHGPKHHSTLLTSGDNMLKSPGKYGSAATAMAVHGDRILLAGVKVNRLSTVGGSTGKNLEGPVVSFEQQPASSTANADLTAAPRSAALSPDGRWLYLTGYVWNRGYPRGHAWLHGVARLDLQHDDAPLETFAGRLEREADGVDPGQFRCPTSVACDAAGQVYVADYMNDRIQVFAPDGKHLKSITHSRPSVLQVDPESGQIYVFSWFLINRFLKNTDRIPAQYARLGPLADPRVQFTAPLPLNNYKDRIGLRWTGLEYNAAVDTFAQPAAIWLVPGKPGTTEQLQILRGLGGGEADARLAHLRILEEGPEELVLRRDFGEETARSVVRTKPPVISRQRLYVNPASGKLYLGEGDSGVNKSFEELLEIDPNTGDIRVVPLPFTAEDICFGVNGAAYLRTDTIVGRYDSRTWREIPWDYGEERTQEGFDPSVKSASLVSALVLPAEGRPAYFHMGGMCISPRGELAVACFNTGKPLDRREFQSDGSLSKRWASTAGRKYLPSLYPGRVRYGEVHVWDVHGQLIHEDAVPGLGATDGIAIDKQGNLYALASAHRLFGGEPYFLPWTETLFKISPSAGKLVAGSDRANIPAEKHNLPERSPDMANHTLQKVWIEGADWKYGGVGFGSQTGGCVCWNARFALDYFDRVFAPEVDHFTVAVLDSSGNLLLRIGDYGNVDDGLPLVKQGGPADPRSIGGDETALFHAAYVASHTDHRLFIADAGNRRILSVKLDYHATRRLPLSSLPAPAVAPGK